MIRRTPDDLRKLINDQFPDAIQQFVIPIGPPQSPPIPTASEPIEPGPGASHSRDFASVNWFGRVFSFTRPQAEIIAALWQAWRDGNPFLHQQTLLDIAGSDGTRVRDCFKDHPAWGTMLRHGPSCGGMLGTYRLLPPDSDDF